MHLLDSRFCALCLSLVLSDKSTEKGGLCIIRPNYFRYYILPACLYAGLIFFLSSLSQMPATWPALAGADKIVHLGEYFIFGYLLARALVVARWPACCPLSTAAIIGILYALSDEWHQSFVPGRDASGYDLLFDAAGLLFAAGSFRRLRYGVKPLVFLENRLEEALKK